MIVRVKDVSDSKSMEVRTCVIDCVCKGQKKDMIESLCEHGMLYY